VSSTTGDVSSCPVPFLKVEWLKQGASMPKSAASQEVNDEMTGLAAGVKPGANERWTSNFLIFHTRGGVFHARGGVPRSREFARAYFQRNASHAMLRSFPARQTSNAGGCDSWAALL
jgi:hypothetical protein